jgi:hypothetical protein
MEIDYVKTVCVYCHCDIYVTSGCNRHICDICEDRPGGRDGRGGRPPYVMESQFVGGYNHADLKCVSSVPRVVA